MLMEAVGPENVDDLTREKDHMFADEVEMFYESAY
jgi:hypothetical protein